MSSKKYIKGFLEDIVLHLIGQEGEMYGYDLTKRVEELSTGAIKITEGALYPILHKLENEEKLTATFKEANGRLRKYYTLTPIGGKKVETSAIDLLDFIGGLQQLFNVQPASK
jgi:DNA-binding PadR family transcriptional regulator